MIPKKPRLIILVGIPGSGKSTFANHLTSVEPNTYVRINQDELVTRKACESATRSALRKSKTPIIDRCNFNDDQRRYFIHIAREFDVDVDCIVFNFSKSECLNRCLKRKNHPTVDSTNASYVVHQIANQLKKPDARLFTNEGITRLEIISNENDIKSTISYYLHLAK